MKLRNVIYLLIISIFLVGCGSDPQKSEVASIDPNESALPHGTTLPTQAMSKSDIDELRNAKGKKAMTISPLKLIELVAAKKKILQCFVFWNSNCSVCQTIVKRLETKELETKQIQISLITEETDVESLNLFIRQQNIVPKVYRIKSRNNRWKKSIDKDWDGSLPAILIVNSVDNSHQFYPLKSLNEFEAIITPLLP